MSNSDNNSVNKPSVKLISRLASGEIPDVVEQAALVVEGEEQTDARFSYSPRWSVAFSSSTEGGQEDMQALSPPLTSAPDDDDGDDESWLDNDDDPNFTKRPSLLDDEWPEEKEPTQRRSRRMSKWKFEQYELPQSTFTFLITEKILSKPFIVAIIALCLSLMSLTVVLINELGNGTAKSPYGLPAGVSKEVIIAQYLGIIIGVLMEQEVPNALEIISQTIEQHMLGRHPFNLMRIFVSCMLRLAVGYLFLACLFLAVIQSEEVLDIFFDVLALEFVENIDDVIYALAKRGFFGKRLRRAAHKTHSFEATGDAKTSVFARRAARFVGFVYFCNAGLMIFGMTYLMIRQDNGEFRCNSVHVGYKDDVWEESWIKLADGTFEKRLLVYSHFNGIYVENGTHDGRPKYTEQNKEDGSPFRKTVGAEIIYCEDLESWVFRHANIFTSHDDQTEENECSWLLRSPQTESFDIIEVARESDWSVWTGYIEPDYSISITCNECTENSGCNYHGDCIDQRCHCYKGKYGIHCEDERPCEEIRSEKDGSTLHLLHDDQNDLDHFVEVYGHPKYYAENMTGIPSGFMKLSEYNDDAFKEDDFFDIHLEMESFQKLLEDYVFVLKFTGWRWYGQIRPPDTSAKSFVEEEFHAYWDMAFSGLGVDDNATVIISAPQTHVAASPVGVDFFEMRRRNRAPPPGVRYDYSPFGVMIPLVNAVGSGYFHCNVDEK